MCCFPHFINDAHSFHEKAAAFVCQSPAEAGGGQPLARASKCDNVHGWKRPAVEPGDIPHMGHVRKVPFRDGHALRYDLAGPQGTYAIKRSGIGETAYAVKKRTQCQIGFIAENGLSHLPIF